MSDVRISKELFMELVKYHIGGLRTREDFIRAELQDKLERVVRHENYFSLKEVLDAKDTHNRAD